MEFAESLLGTETSTPDQLADFRIGGAGGIS